MVVVVVVVVIVVVVAATGGGTLSVATIGFKIASMGPTEMGGAVATLTDKP